MRNRFPGGNTETTVANSALAIHPVTRQNANQVLTNIQQRCQCNFERDMAFIDRFNVCVIHSFQPNDAHFRVIKENRPDLTISYLDLQYEQTFQRYHQTISNNLATILNPNDGSLDLSNLHQSVDLIKNSNTAFFILKILIKENYPQLQISNIRIPRNRLNFSKANKVPNRLQKFFPNVSCDIFDDGNNSNNQRGGPNPQRGGFTNRNHRQNDENNESDENIENDEQEAEPRNSRFNRQQNNNNNNSNNNNNNVQDDVTSFLPGEVLSFPPPLKLPSVRFQTNIENAFNLHVSKIMDYLFTNTNDKTFEAASRLYAPTAVFSYTLSNKVKLLNKDALNLYECNLAASKHSEMYKNKWIGAQFIVGKLREIADLGINLLFCNSKLVLPAASIGPNLYSVVVHAINDGAAAVHTFTVMDCNEIPPILSHQAFIYN